MIELVVLRRAESDLQLIYDRLEDFQSAKGEEFLRQLEIAYDHLRLYPEIGPVYYRQYRRLLLGRFPYGLLYCIEGGRLIIVTAASLQQDPTALRAILDDPAG
jgi:plasmid stabilization system protein ParE